MAVNIDTVYQRVLSLANKEQRGYITPQEFNLFANQAQMEIFEQYFYDLNQFRKIHGNQTDYADVDDMLQEKLQIFERSEGPTVINDPTIYIGAGVGGVNKILPDYIYRVNRVEFNNVECEILNTKDFNDVKNAPYLLKPTYTRPVANIRNNQLRCFVGTNVTPTGVFYYKIPAKVNWAYIVMNNKAMYNEGGGDVHFELHRSEETQLVNKILKLAGISIKHQDVAQAGQGMEAATIQQQPKI